MRSIDRAARIFRTRPWSVRMELRPTYTGLAVNREAACSLSSFGTGRLVQISPCIFSTGEIQGDESLTNVTDEVPKVHDVMYRFLPENELTTAIG